MERAGVGALMLVIGLVLLIGGLTGTWRAVLAALTRGEAGSRPPDTLMGEPARPIDVPTGPKPIIPRETIKIPEEWQR